MSNAASAASSMASRAGANGMNFASGFQYLRKSISVYAAEVSEEVSMATVFAASGPLSRVTSTIERMRHRSDRSFGDDPHRRVDCVSCRGDKANVGEAGKEVFGAARWGRIADVVAL